MTRVVDRCLRFLWLCNVSVSRGFISWVASTGGIAAYFAAVLIDVEGYQ